MTKEEVLSILQTHPNGNIEEFNFKKKYLEIYQDILSWNFPQEFKFTQKLYHYFNNDPDLKLGLCPVCGNRCKFTKFNNGYLKHCSKKCVNKDKVIREKIKQTNLEKYGVINPMQSYEIRSKMEKTCLERYGEKHALLVNIFKEKSKETCLERYGVDSYTKTEECHKKIKETCQERYGVNFFIQSKKFKEKSKETCLERYGVDNPMKLIEIKQKVEDTCLKRYNVKNYAQTKEFAKYHRKQIEYDDLTFDSSWEVTVYKYCKENNIPCEYQPDVTFEYEYCGKKHYYHPDFLIDGKLYEVKGKQFFDGDKMICPYDRGQDGLYEAKHQCMIKNNIIILKENDIKSCILH